MSDTLGAARATRRRAIMLGGASAGGARTIGMACSLVQVPVLLSLLGAEGFGVWATLQAVFALMGMLDFGIGYRLQNAIAEFSARHQMEQVQSAVTAVVAITGCIAAVLGLLVLLPDATFWTNRLGIRDSSFRDSLGPSLGTLVAIGLVTAPTNIALRLASGLQRNWAIGLSQAVASIISLGTVLACAATNASAVTAIAATLMTPIAVNAIMLAAMWRRLPRAVVAQARRTDYRGWFSAGIPFFFPQLANALRTTLPPFLIATLLGAAAVTPFALVQRLLNFMSQPQAWLLDPLWPAYADASSRGDWSWVKRALRLSLAATVVFGLFPTLSVLVWGPQFIEWWAGFSAAALPAGLLLWLVLAHAALVLTQPITICLNGLGRMHGQMIYGSISVALSLAGMAWACASAGLEFAAAPLALVMVAVNLPCAGWDLRRQLQHAPQRKVTARTAPA